MSESPFEMTATFEIAENKFVRLSGRRFGNEIAFTAREFAVIEALQQFKAEAKVFPMIIESSETPVKVVDARIKTTKMWSERGGTEFQVKCVITDRAPVEEPKIELNAVGQGRVIEIQHFLQTILREHFHQDDVSRFDAILVDASVAMFKIEEVVAQQQSRVVEAMKALCETQDDVTKGIAKADPEKIKEYIALRTKESYNPKA